MYIYIYIITNAEIIHRVSLDYALSNPSHVGAVDPFTKLQYTSMLYAQVDAVTFAAARLGYGNVPVHVSETGWPSKGDADEAGATVENARQYNRNLLMRQVSGEGTPLRPRLRLEVYLFALFNEDMKPGPTSERNYGLYQPDMSMVYNVGLSQLSTTNAASLSLATSPAARTTVRASFLLATSEYPIRWVNIYIILLMTKQPYISMYIY